MTLSLALMLAVTVVAFVAALVLRSSTPLRWLGPVILLWPAVYFGRLAVVDPRPLRIIVAVIVVPLPFVLAYRAWREHRASVK